VDSLKKQIVGEYSKMEFKVQDATSGMDKFERQMAKFDYKMSEFTDVYAPRLAQIEEKFEEIELKKADT
jgi:hypothetical protein